MKTKENNKNTASTYHHGDLHSCLITTATTMISEEGIEALSLRKLALRIGVSRTAAYHHFKDKNDLLSAIAAQGFVSWQAQAERLFTDKKSSEREKFQNFVHHYVRFATQNAAIYQLMFGNTLWKKEENNSETAKQSSQSQSSQNLKDVAYPSFQYQVKMIKAWQHKGMLPSTEPSLRLAQVTWATLHGIAQLVIDGIYADASQIDEMCQCAVNLLLASSK
ncbi:TetR family transcriptional regulator [Colwellia sp. 39_35_sub15_T18]|nr:TetR family transcriptional regulator [Colwellia sp. 39_35_sub15_T18]